MSKIIVGLTGLKGSGKDTAAQGLIDHGFVVVKFADGLKNMLRALLRTAGEPEDMIERWVEGDLKEVPCPALRDRTTRHAMQTLGTEWGRQLIADDLWTATFERAISSTDKNVVVTDLRFANELAVLQKYTKHLYRIQRGIVSSDLHPSETFVAEMPVEEILNDGSQKDLQMKLISKIFG